MYNPKKYNDHTIVIFEIIGTHIINVFRTDIYNQAKLIFMDETKGISSITEAYKILAPSYIQVFKDGDKCKKAMIDVYRFFSKYKNNQVLSYQSWVDEVTVEFIPKDFWVSIKNNQKDKILTSIILLCVQEFCEYIMTTQALTYIIDNRNKDTLNILQNKMIDILGDQQAVHYQRYINQLTKNPQKNPYKSFLDNIKVELKELYSKHDTLSKHAKAQSVALEKAKKIIDRQNDEIVSLHRKVTCLIAAIKERKRQRQDDDVDPDPELEEAANAIPSFDYIDNDEYEYDEPLSVDQIMAEREKKLQS